MRNVNVVKNQLHPLDASALQFGEIVITFKNNQPVSITHINTNIVLPLTPANGSYLIKK